MNKESNRIEFKRELNDYNLGTPVVEIFADRITVTSAGGLVNGLSRADLLNCRSMPRNRILMRVFRDVELVESLGSDMTRILGTYDPSIFELTPNFFVVTFPLESEEKDGIHVGKSKHTDELKSDDKFDDVGDPPNVLEAIIQAAILRNPKVNKEALAMKTGKSRATVTRLIKSLIERGEVKRIGSDKTGHWEVVMK